MAYDEALAERTRDALTGRESVSERKMFGGLAFMVGGNMACGVIGEDLMVRLEAEDAERALSEKHTRPMDFTGRPMKGFLYVAPAGATVMMSSPLGSSWQQITQRRCHRSKACPRRAFARGHRLHGIEQVAVSLRAEGDPGGS